MFHLTEQEVGASKSQIVTLDDAQVNVEIMRAFVRLRGLIGHNRELARRLAAGVIPSGHANTIERAFCRAS